MTDNEDDITVTMADSIDRGKATRPWSLNEMTVQEIDHLDSLHRRLDTAFVPWGVEEPVDNIEVLFTIDERVLDRRDRKITDVVNDVAALVADDPRLDEYVVWDHIDARAEAARIDDSRTRVRIEWKARGDDA